ncbi:DJ-1/PfpI family protein [Methylocella sp. CPCC 101449]|uniref:DJ-1/PfpI family protein n=1 Tax=Methylocella sp. CPCC 101449 TaxID=2987531 RepID=UPI00288FB579|nr:DJ-1/PfpI family protein [Methylocella sp. CPCC 101449]MDT2022309.1 DJ-1/PfpI family protein [Methylocella sp. CPCC 101449]
MNKVVWGALGLGVLAALGGGAWLLSLPPAPAATVPAPIAQAETAAMIAALKPKRPRPLIAIVGVNEGTEVTDYLMPYGILKRADIADVVALATKPGPMTLYPTLKIEPEATIADFDARHSGGADYVIVPAMVRDDDPGIMAWLKSQADKGAIIVSVCAGAKVVASAGLLDGKRATTHWYYLKELRGKHPSITYVANRRMVIDNGVATTTGITASMPMMLTLIEAIAGRAKAESVAQGLGLADWDARHDSAAFTFTRPFALTAISNTLAFWNREELGLELTEGMDEVSLALVTDAWSRTYHSQAYTYAASPEARESRNGLRILPDRITTRWPAERQLTTFTDVPPALALDQNLAGIASRYDKPTADFVAMQLEYPQPKSRN